MKLATLTTPGDGNPRGGRSATTPSSPSRRLDRARPPGRRRPHPRRRRACPLADVTLLAPHVPRGDLRCRLELPRARRGAGRAPARGPIVFLKLPTSAAPPFGAVHCPEVVRRLDYEGELAVVMGAGGEIAGYTVRRRRQRARPADAATAVDAREGRRRVLPVRPVDDDGRRGARSRGPAGCGPGSTATCARTRGPTTSSSASRAHRLPLRDLHVRARRPPPHRHADRRRGGRTRRASCRPATSYGSRSSRSASIEHPVS